MNTQFNQSHVSGLSVPTAAEILKREGLNELPAKKKQNSLATLIRILSEPMLLLLIGSGFVYLLMGEIKDSLMLVSAVFVVIGITFYQERKTENTLEALKNLSSPRALVIRDSQQIRIPGREVVMGDIIIISEGDRVPADAVVLSCSHLLVDESLLTGESLSVTKSEWDGKLAPTQPGGDNLPFVYSGTLVVSGRGFARVTATGQFTQMGKIGKSLGNIEEEDTLLKRETAKVVRLVAIGGIFVCILVVLAYTFIRGNLIQGILAGLTLSMSMLPEEFPVVLLIFMTLGAWRISKNKVLTRRPAAIESLGAATVLCTDKTGTLTMNKMQLTSIYVPGKFFEMSDLAPADLPEKFHQLLEYGVLASQENPFDPIEKELVRMGDLYLKHTRHLHGDWQLVKEYSLSKHLLAISRVWQSPDNENFIISTKGAPEAILDLCHVNKSERAKILKTVLEMSDKGLRVLATAKAKFTADKLPSDQHDFTFEFLGLYGFVDPVRPTVSAAVQEAYAAGMRVIVITGDYPGTAQYVARKIGIKNPDIYLTGSDLDRLDPAELREKIKTTNIFARVVPEQKLLIVNALKANGEIVAMTGDGVNDAPALKAAHIGIAMGERGTDVAREAAELVLLDDDFSSIVIAVSLGRRIFDNIKRAMGYVLAVHVPIAGMSLLPLLFNFPVVLLPAHIAFLELIIDPACSTVFESVQPDEGIMKRPPRRLNRPMLDFRTVALSLLQGLGVLLATFSLFIYIVRSGRGDLEARTFAFVTLVLANLLLIVINLSWTKTIKQILLSANKILLLVTVGALLCLLVVLYVPFFTDLFHLTPLYPGDFLIIIPVVFASLIWFEFIKLFRRSPVS